MSKELFTKNRIRKYFGKIREVAEMPNLIEVQKSSYDLFLNDKYDVILNQKTIERVKNFFQ